KPAGVILSLLRESVFTSVNAGRGAHRKSIRAMKGISRAAERVAELCCLAEPRREGAVMI
ncbi:MAG: hypothetical protein IJY93_08795, partial [Clostridia bacterium]|nr:hypothetical protein [Clostridia bacterium]